MSRLVDIEDVKALIMGLDSLPWEEEIDDLCDAIPTAYDVEKVMEQLDKLECHIIGRHYFENGVEAAMEVVKRGGVDEC